MKNHHNINYLSKRIKIQTKKAKKVAQFHEQEYFKEMININLIKTMAKI